MSQKIIIMFNYTHLRKKLNYSVYKKNTTLEREYTFRLWDWVTQILNLKL